jgi:hypothetical protein
VDREAEEQASLLDILSHAIDLPVAYATDKKNDRRSYYYKPVGILRSKTPPELRTAKTHQGCGAI